MQRIGGVSKLTLNGTEYSLKAGAEYSLSTSTKEVVVGENEVVVGYIKKDFRAAMIKGEIILNENTASDFLKDEESISAELVYKGKTLIGSDGVDVGEGLMKTEDGSMEIEIHFTSLVEV